MSAIKFPRIPRSSGVLPIGSVRSASVIGALRTKPMGATIPRIM